MNVYLTSGNFWADLVAGIGYTSESNSPVIVTVTTPDGDVVDLGAITGSGSTTNSYELFYAPAGTYVFYFTSAISTPYEVVGYIYD